jgi:hypothetical protein
MEASSQAVAGHEEQLSYVHVDWSYLQPFWQLLHDDGMQVFPLPSLANVMQTPPFLQSESDEQAPPQPLSESECEHARELTGTAAAAAANPSVNKPNRTATASCFIMA